MEKRKNLVIFIVCCVFVFFYYGGGFMVNYQMDTYYAINAPKKMFDAMLYTDGRWLNAVIYYVLRFPWSNYSVFYYISFVLSLVVMILAIYRYAGCFYKEIVNKTESFEYGTAIFAAIISCLMIGNMFSLEFFLYPDMMIMYILSIYLCVEATVCYIEFSQIDVVSQKIKKIIKAFCCLFFCVFMAETTTSLFVILTLPYVLAKSSSFKKFLKNQITTGFLYGMAMVCKFVYTMFVVKTQRASFDKMNFTESAKTYAPIGKSPQTFVLDRITFGMWFFALGCIIVIVKLVVEVLKQHREYEIIKGLYMAGVCVIVSLVPYILKVTNDFKPRIYYPLGAFLCMFIVYGCLQHIISINKHWNYAIQATIFVIAIVQWLSFFQMFTDQYITNYEDRYISRMIGDIIENYEYKTDKKVKYVVFYSDGERTKYARDEGWCITQRGFDIGASYLEALNFYLGSSYEAGIVDSNLANQFISRNWNTFSSEQVVIKDETVHICAY